MKQRQFLDVVDEAVAHARFDAACDRLQPKTEEVPLVEALGRVLAAEVVARVDVPGFDRSNMDGFAVRSEDTVGAQELEPVDLRLADLSLAAGDAPPPDFELKPGTAVQIATGGVVPRGADAVVMVENTRPSDSGLAVDRAVAPGANITHAGSDIGRGEVVLRSGTRLMARDAGIVAAVGVEKLVCFARPRVAVVSTGDEIIEPGRPIAVGQVYDSNQRILLDTVSELGCVAVPCGIVPDDEEALAGLLRSLIEGEADVVLLSGGTSKGEGDLNATVVARLAAEYEGSAGIVAHGVALKPGKPILLSVIGGKPVVVLPGFPTSAIFTFHEFVAPLLRRLSGVGRTTRTTVGAVAPFRINSVPGRTEYSLVDLIEGPDGLAAYPLGAGSGSVTAFARADGFIRIPAATEIVAAGTELEVQLLEPDLEPADLIAIGSHCIGLDHLLGLVAAAGFRVKSVPVGSTGGLAALARGEGDVAGVHLLDEVSGEYNEPFLPDGVDLIKGYRRRQGIVFRRGDLRFDEEDPAVVLRDRELRMVNRNVGSGTRIIIDGLLGGARPPGYLHQAKTHHAVAAAVEQGRADWGVTLDTVAAAAGLSFIFLADEQYDLAVRRESRDRPAVGALLEQLDAGRADLERLGFPG